MQVVVQNSFCKIEGDIPPLVDETLRQVFTYENDIESEKGVLFHELREAKDKDNKKAYFAILAKIKALEATQFVCLYKDRGFPTGLLNMALETFKVLQVPYRVVDLRESPGKTAILRWRNPPWEQRYYQKEMHSLGMLYHRGVFESAVGTGKSLVMAYLIHEISCMSLIIVPSRGLSGQLYNDFCAWFGYENVQLLDAEKIRKLKKPKPISIVTVQSLASLVKTGEFAKFAKWIDAVFVDEVHHAGASTYTKLLTDMQHVYYRFGFSGTFLRNDHKTLEMWSFLSNVLYQYPAHKAISEGYLTPVKVKFYRMSGKSNRNYQKEYDNHYCGNPELLAKIHQIVAQNPSSQILILVNKKDKGGKIIHEYLNALGVDNSYISGDNDKDEINQTIAAFNEKQVKVLVGSSVIGEGIDVRSTDHLIMCQGGKSEITMVQAAGRAIRLYEGKTVAYIHDFCFVGAKYMEKHVIERQEIYLRNFNCEILEG